MNMPLSEMQNFLAAIAIGGLIGLQREISKKGHDRSSFAGFRTFILISFLGAVTCFIGDKIGYQPLPVIAFFVFSILIIVAYYISAKKGFVGITSEMTAILTFLLGILVMNEGYEKYAIIFAVLITILLSFKQYVHKAIEHASIEEWYGSLKFAFIAFVILPLLPDRYIGPGEFFNPYDTWLMVVFVSGVSFVGYFCLKYFGERIGMSLLGVFGGIASSTALTTAVSKQSKDAKPAQQIPLANAALIASCIMFLRVIVETFIINQYVAERIMLLLVLMSLVGAAFVLPSFYKASKNAPVDLNLKSPFSLMPALEFTGLYLLMELVSKSLYSFNFGMFGVLIAGIVMGSTNVDAVVLSAATVAASGGISIAAAGVAIIGAVFGNTFLKLVFAYLWGGKEFIKRYRFVSILTFLVGLVGFITMLLLDYFK